MFYVLQKRFVTMDVDRNSFYFRFLISLCFLVVVIEINYLIFDMRDKIETMLMDNLFIQSINNKQNITILPLNTSSAMEAFSD